MALRTVLAAALLLLPALGFAQDPPIKKVALLVGVNKYQRRGFEDLRFAERDVDELGKALTNLGFTCTVLKGSSKASQKATKANIEAQLNQLLKGVSKHDIVLVALSGHGQQLRVEDAQGSSREDQFYCPVDAINRDPASQFSLSFLIDEQLAKRGGRNVILVDACRDEPDDPGRGAKGVQGSVVSLPEDTAILFSCRAGQRSYEKEELGGGHGVFTHCVLEALRGSSQQKTISWTDVVAHVNRRMQSEEIRRLLPTGVKQTPIQASVLPYTELGAIHAVPPGQVNRLGMQLKLIPAGPFRMGSQLSVEQVAEQFAHPSFPKSLNAKLERPAKSMRVFKPFYLGAHEVTVAQFRTFVTETNYVTDAEDPNKKPRPGGFGWDAAKETFGFGTQFSWKRVGFAQTDDHPVVNVSYRDAVQFCAWLTRKEGRVYRLPNETEWEYACRAGTSGLYSIGKSAQAAARRANLWDAAFHRVYKRTSNFTTNVDDGHAFTARVGSFAANPWGLFDTHGNVAEWCTPSYPPAKGMPPSIKPYRGGHFMSPPIFARSASRNGSQETMGWYKVGFRVVMEAPRR